MSHSTPPTPAETVATFLRGLIQAAVTRELCGFLSSVTVALLTARFQILRLRFERLAAKIRAGTYRPQRTGPRRQASVRKPRQNSQLARKIGWLADLLPEAAQHRGQLIHILQQPDMLALIAAAPAPMARLLRPLCWALRLKPPDILPNPRRPAGAPPPPAPPKYQPPPPRQDSPAPKPANVLGLHPMQLALPAPAKTA